MSIQSYEVANTSVSDGTEVTNIPNLNLTIPNFSDGVRSALKDGNSLEVWNQMIEELLVYYIREYPTRLRCSNDYQQIGKLMYKTYPCTSRFGTHPWVRHSFQITLISYVLNYIRFAF